MWGGEYFGARKMIKYGRGIVKKNQLDSNPIFIDILENRLALMPILHHAYSQVTFNRGTYYRGPENRHCPLLKGAFNRGLRRCPGQIGIWGDNLLIALGLQIVRL